MRWIPPGDFNGIEVPKSQLIDETKHQEESAVKNMTIAIDLAKSVFQVGSSDRPGPVSKSHRLSVANCKDQ